MNRSRAQQIMFHLNKLARYLNTAILIHQISAIRMNV